LTKGTEKEPSAKITWLAQKDNTGMLSKPSSQEEKWPATQPKKGGGGGGFVGRSPSKERFPLTVRGTAKREGQPENFWGGGEKGPSEKGKKGTSMDFKQKGGKSESEHKITGVKETRGALGKDTEKRNIRKSIIKIAEKGRKVVVGTRKKGPRTRTTWKGESLIA